MPGAWALGALVVASVGVAAMLGWRRWVDQRAALATRGRAQVPAATRLTATQPVRNIGAPEARRAPSPDGSLPEQTIDQEVVERYLVDIRDALAADDVILWTYDDGNELLPTASACGGTVVPVFEISPSPEDLLRWAVEQDMVASNVETDDAFFLATTVGRGDRLHGVVAMYAADRRRISRERIKGYLPRYAARLGLLLDLLQDGRGARRYRDKAVLLAKAAERVQGSKDMPMLGQAVCDTAIEISGGTRAAFVLWNEEAEAGQVCGTSSGHPVATGFRVAAESFVGTACRERQRFTTARTSGTSGLPLLGPAEPARPIGSFAVVPLQRDHHALGAIVVEGERESQITTEEGSLLLLLASVASQALANVRRLEEVTTASITDPLTQLPNRRMFDDRLRQHLAECDRFGQVLSLIVVDIDHFKRINDTHGHAAGDAVLVAVAQTIAHSLRTIDLCARYGGEELAILLPQTSIEAAREVAERLRKAVEAVRVPAENNVIGVTISLGVASYPLSSRNRETFFSCADSALYAAKHAGRNRVMVSDPN